MLSRHSKVTMHDNKNEDRQATGTDFIKLTEYHLVCEVIAYKLKSNQRVWYKQLVHIKKILASKRILVENCYSITFLTK